MARNLSGRDESRSINENDRWVFDDLGCNIVEEAGLRRSISRQSRCLCTPMDFIGHNLGGVRIELRMEECKGSHAQVRPTLTGVCLSTSLIPSPNKSLRCRAQPSGVVKLIVSTF